MEPSWLRRLSSVGTRPAPGDSEVFTLRFSVRESESDIGGTRARERAPRGWRRERGEASSPRRCWPQLGWGAQGDCENPVAVVAAATQDGAVSQDQNLEAAPSEVKPAQPCSSTQTGGPVPSPNHRELRPL